LPALQLNLINLSNFLKITLSNNYAKKYTPKVAS
jgi:hypothetical protein